MRNGDKIIVCITCVRKNISINENIWDSFEKFCKEEDYKYSHRIEFLIRSDLIKQRRAPKKKFTQKELDEMEYEVSDL